MIHINQSTYLHSKLKESFPNLKWEQINNLKLDEAKYKYLLALWYQNEKAKLDSELFKLGLFN